jgi:hypothetical protein
VAAFLDSDENFMIYRRFGFLHARVLLRKQDKLREMEEALDTMDTRDAKASDPLPNRALMSREIDESDTNTSPHGTRAELLDKVEDDLAKYGKQSNYNTLLYYLCKD